MNDLRITPNKNVQDLVNVVEEDVRKFLAARGINSTVSRFEAIKYRYLSILTGRNYFVMVCNMFLFSSYCILVNSN